MHGDPPPPTDSAGFDYDELWRDIAAQAFELGFSGAGVATLDTREASAHLAHWLAQGRHGAMDYMARHASLRAAPEHLLSEACRAISVRHDYWPQAADSWSILESPDRAYVSRYALGRDYHKTLRRKLELLAQWIRDRVGPFGYRVCVDSAPVFETELATRAGIGWRGKHTLTLTRRGSWHFLGEILTDLPLRPTPAVSPHCGSCRRCLDLCPTGAIVAPYQVDARLCISYLTIEHPGSIPIELRPAIGNRIYGCDDCQLVCPWNRFARSVEVPDFAVRYGLDSASLVELFQWSETDFNDRLAGMAIRRIGWERWLRNVAVGLGNALSERGDINIRTALRQRADHPSALVREHVAWALHHEQPSTQR